MVVRNLKIIKKPRSSPIPDKPIAFPPLENLHLELLENKKKIKPGLPLIPIKPRKPPQPHIPPKESFENIKAKSGGSSEKKSKLKSEKEKKKIKKRDDGDKDLINELGEDDEDDEIEAELGESEEEEEVEEEGEEENKVNEEDEEDDEYAGLSPEEREAKEKEEYIWRFRILKKKYKNPSVPIPEYNEHSDLSMMKNSYESTIKELYLDDNVETYRSYLVGSFIAIEFVSTQWLGIDLAGYTIQQTKMMQKYDRLLIELGERPYNSWGSNLPVEVRLIGFVLIQAGIFYLGKIITAKFGGTVADLFKGITGQPPDSNTDSDSSPNKPKPKRRMRGPKHKAEDIRKMHEDDEDE